MRALLAATVLLVLAPAAPAAAGRSESAARPDQAGALVAGGAHTCGLTTARAVRCWGFGDSGRLG